MCCFRCRFLHPDLDFQCSSVIFSGSLRRFRPCSIAACLSQLMASQVQGASGRIQPTVLLHPLDCAGRLPKQTSHKTSSVSFMSLHASVRHRVLLLHGGKKNRFSTTHLKCNVNINVFLCRRLSLSPLPVCLLSSRPCGRLECAPVVCLRPHLSRHERLGLRFDCTVGLTHKNLRKRRRRRRKRET